MKLLIADDEKLTRVGLYESIPWKELHIDEVYLADDGLHGLELVKRHQPEIILSDVRMPRMDGITMAEKIQELYPDTCIIFMSGYSDKEYLKAAIKLKAISYVEKPINHLEVKEAVEEAVKNIEQIRRSRHSELLQYQEKSSRLAVYITQDGKSQEEAAQMLAELKLPVSENTYFTTCIVEFMTPISDMPGQKLKNALEEFSRAAELHRHKILYAYKNDFCLLVHFYSGHADYEQGFDRCIEILSQTAGAFGDYFIAVGKRVCGIRKVFLSYNSAAAALQRGFFNEKNTVLREGKPEKFQAILTDMSPKLREVISSKDREQALKVADCVWQSLYDCRTMLPGQVKDIYYKYFMQLENALDRNQILPENNVPDVNDTIWGRISKCKTLKELHEIFCRQIEELFDALEEGEHENPVIFRIKDFIRKNISNEALSVKDISEYAHLSPSYACTLFKNETGKTLNQYITEFRMELAKQLLEDLRYSINEISSRVGYSDGNYFSKTFKKAMGLTPSEYREKMLR